MTWVAVAVGVGTVAYGAIKSNQDSTKADHAMDAQLKNRPKYGTENVNLAKSRYLGRDKAVLNAEKNIDQDASNAVYDAKNVTSSTSSLLATIAAINSNQSLQRRGLAAQESQLGDERFQAYTAENDKQFEYDQNMPYQLRVAYLRDKAKQQQQMDQAIIGAGAGIAGGANYGGASFNKKKKYGSNADITDQDFSDAG